MHAYILTIPEMHYKSEENTVTHKILGVFGSQAKALAFAEANNLHNPDNYYRRENDPDYYPQDNDEEDNTDYDEEQDNTDYIDDQNNTVLSILRFTVDDEAPVSRKIG